MTILTVLLNILGALALGLAAWGLLKFPDVLCRAHSITKAATLGLGALTLAWAVEMASPQAWGLALVAIFFQFLTIPLSGHLLAMIAYRRDIRRHKRAALVR